MTDQRQTIQTERLDLLFTSQHLPQSHSLDFKERSEGDHGKCS